MPCFTFWATMCTQMVAVVDKNGDVEDGEQKLVRF